MGRRFDSIFRRVNLSTADRRDELAFKSPFSTSVVCDSATSVGETLMKVAIVVWKIFPSFMGGTERHSLHLANHLSRLVDVDVICAEVPHGQHNATRPFKIVPVGWNETVPNLVATFAFSKTAARWMAREEYDVAYGQKLGLWQYVRRKQIPCVMNPHGLEPFKVSNILVRGRGWLRRYAFRYTAQHSDVVVSLGGKLTEEIQRFLRVPQSSVVVLPAGVDVDEISARQEIESASKIRNSFLCVARLVDNKGLDKLIDAFRCLPSTSGAHLYLVGDGPLRDRLMRTAPTSVTFLGRLSDQELNEWYRRSEVFVLSSLFEGMPGVILEAMAHSLPVIATDIGAVSTMVSDDNGKLVDPGDTMQLADAIMRFVCLTPEAKERLGRRSRELVEANFAWEKVAYQTASVLSGLVEGGEG